jgi:hypothetical protein
MLGTQSKACRRQAAGVFIGMLPSSGAFLFLWLLGFTSWRVFVSHGNRMPRKQVRRREQSWVHDRLGSPTADGDMRECRGLLMPLHAGLRTAVSAGDSPSGANVMVQSRATTPLFALHSSGAEAKKWLSRALGGTLGGIGLKCLHAHVRVVSFLSQQSSHCSD